VPPAQAGVDVALIERGARFPLGGFPRHVIDRQDSLLWHHGGPYDVRPLNDVLVVQAAGYGGGSLVYANVQMRVLTRPLATPEARSAPSQAVGGTSRSAGSRFRIATARPSGAWN
jgi:hypothetical protein